VGRARLGIAGLCVLVYAGPLFWPPAPVAPGTLTAADAWLPERILPGVPPLWVAVRLVALAAAAVLFAGAPGVSLPDPFHGGAAESTQPGLARRLLAVALGLVLACCAPYAPGLGPAGQGAYLVALFAPALVLAMPGAGAMPGRSRSWRCAAPVAVVVGAWIGLRLVGDLCSPRVADVVDGWLGFIASMRFASEHLNVLTDVYHPEIAGVGGMVAAFHGALLAQLGILDTTFERIQVLQILWIALGAAGLAALARALVGSGVAAIAVAIFLFAPYTRFVTLFPGPFLVGPLYAVAIALLTVRACRRRSEAALAALGAAAGLGLGFPGVVPTVGLFGLVTVWYLLPNVRRVWAGAVAGLASFAAAAVPLLPNVLALDKIRAHFRWEGASALNDAVLIGQISLRDYHPLIRDVLVRPLDIVAAAFLSPFAHPRLAIRLWGDAIFDPVGAVLVAIGVVACVRACRRSSAARVLLLFFVAALAPAFVSPFEVVDITHALVTPVPDAAAWSAATRRRAIALGIVVVGVGGTLLFDVVTPRIISASSSGIMFAVVEPAALERVVLVDYESRLIPNAAHLYQETIARWGGARPVGYLAYDGGRFPRRDLPAEGKDLLFWSHALDRDYELGDAVCRRWPQATLYEIWDPAHLGRAYAARIGDAAWAPRTDAGRWTSWDCTAERVRSKRPPS
jgi:hypothetical protein